MKDAKFYDKEGKKIDYHTWSKLRWDDESYWRVALTEEDGYSISTVWMGIDASYDDSKLIFETLVSGSGRPGNTRKYSTLEEALKGHEELVASCKKRRNLQRD